MKPPKAALSLLVAALAAGVALMLAHVFGNGRYIDFNLYYYAGLLERSSTYTDTPTLLKMVSDAGLHSPNAPAYGAPSLVALFFQPLSFLPFDVAKVLFQAVAAILTVLAMKSLVTSGRLTSGRWTLWLLAALFTPAALLGFWLGNFSIYTTALLILAYVALRDGRDTRAGVLLAIATAFKLYPGFIFFALLFARKWRALGVAVATTAALLLISIPALGWQDTWSAIEATMTIGGGVPDTPQNMSIPGWVVFVTGEQQIADVLSPILLIASLGILWWRRNMPATHVFALACALMLATQSISWLQYAAMNILAVAVVYSVASPRWLRGLAWVAYLLSTGTILMAIRLMVHVPAEIVVTCHTLGAIGVAVSVLLLKAAREPV